MVSRSDELKDEKVRVPKKRLYGKYHDIHAEQFVGGRLIVDNDTSGAETHREEGKGHYHEVNDFDGRVTSLAIGARHEAGVKGLTRTTGESEDKYTKENTREGTHGAKHTEVAKGETKAIGGFGQVSKIDGTQVLARLGQQFDVSSSGSPGGDSTSMDDGDKHVSTRGDLVTYRVGNRIESTEGEVYEDVQGGNKSTVVSQNYKLDVSQQVVINAGQDITITSATKITLKVGGSSIVIEPDKISILCPDGNIITLGKQTDIQGGGPVSPPTTFK